MNYNFKFIKLHKIIMFILLIWTNLPANAQSNEPKNNLGSSIYSMKQKFPELRYIKTDNKGDQYQDGYPKNGVGTFFYFKNNILIEESLVCKGRNGFPYDWYKSMVEIFEEKHPNKGINHDYGKEYIFSTFKVYLIYGSNDGVNYAFVTYQSNSDVSSRDYNYAESQTTNRGYYQQSPNKGKVEWYEIDYTNNKSDVLGMQSVGHFSAKSSPSIFGSRTYKEACLSAIKKIQKKAAKKGARRLLITYMSDLDWDFLTVKVEAIGYK